MEPTQDFKSFQDGLQKSLISTVKTVNRVSAEDLEFQRTVNPEVAQQLDDNSARLLDLSQRLLKSAADACGLKAPGLRDPEDIDLNWRGIVDVVDTVLEKADTALDEYTGLIKRKEPPTENQAPDPKKAKSTSKVIRNANISKPQATFEIQPDNFPTTPWKPILTKKPHAKVPLNKSLVTFTNDEGSLQYKHPYETEITEMEYPNGVFQTAEPIPYKSIDETAPIWVDTYEGVLEMLEHLRKAKEIAVDLEHHDFRTYVGLVSLMQISTREQDWIVDTLKPWRHKLEILNEVFADPSIVKVFHGAYMDMVWLQRDLGLYVNGLFDTYFPCELLGYSGRGLAYLLSTFVGFIADKQYQLADWRMRPLPKEMMYYARSDTHYLLYIYDKVRNDLIASSDRSNPETDLIKRALEKSKEVSLYRHEHPSFNPATGEGSRGWYNYVLKHGHLSLNPEQFAVFRAIWKWRDVAGRKEDENPNYIMSAHTISQIAKINPPDMKALHSLLPLSPSIAKQSLNNIWEEIQAAKAEDGPSLLHFLTAQAPESLDRNVASKLPKQQNNLPEIDGEASGNRLPHSQLFGNMPISSRWEESKGVPIRQADTVPFPWQRFVQETADSQAAAADVEAPAIVEAPATEETPATTEDVEDVDQEFTLKRGKKRKSAPTSENSTSSEGEDESGEEDEDEEDENSTEAADEPMEDVDDGGLIQVIEDKPKNSRKAKKARKAEAKRLEAERAEKRAVKKAAKLARKQEQATEPEAGDAKKFAAVPFDYSQAASVMHANRNGGGAADAKKKDKKKEKVFNPYAKSAEEGVKGARKAPPIRGERSATFKK